MRFERVSKYPDVNLPVRSTIGSAGYDFECAENTTINPHAIVLIPTGIKCQIDDGYYLQLALRSSTPKKKGLMLANGIGIIDSDYYNNPDNEGHIMFQVYNFTDTIVNIPKGERIGQGMFMKYFKIDDDVASGIRTGGFGSTSDKSQENNVSDIIFKNFFGLFSGQPEDTGDCLNN